MEAQAISEPALKFEIQVLSKMYHSFADKVEAGEIRKPLAYQSRGVDDLVPSEQKHRSLNPADEALFFKPFANLQTASSYIGNNHQSNRVYLSSLLS